MFNVLVSSGLSLRCAGLWYCLNCNFCCGWSCFFRSSSAEEKKCVRRLTGKNKWTLAAVYRHSMSSWTTVLGFYLLLYAYQSKKFTEDKATRFAESPPKALQLLTTVLEKDVGAPSTGIQSRKYLTGTFKNTKAGSGPIRHFWITFCLLNYREH